jgi:hypothetical protein
MYIAGDFFYAPDILTFGDADRVIDFNVRYELQFLQNTTGFWSAPLGPDRIRPLV